VNCRLKSRTKLALGIMGVVLVVMVLGSAMAIVYAMPLTIQDRDQTRERDQIRDRDCLQDREQIRERECLQCREQLGNPSTCPNFIDVDGDGIYDNCHNEQSIRAMNQHRYGW
jgi:hypothetical protein